MITLFLCGDVMTGRGLDQRLSMTPIQIRPFKTNRAMRDDATWLRDTIDRESRHFGAQVELRDDHRLALRIERH